MGTTIWIVGTLAALAIFLGYAVFILSRSTGGPVRRRVRCPVRGKELEVVFASDFFERGHYDDVVECSAFGPGGAILCSRACLDLGKDSEEHRPAA